MASRLAPNAERKSVSCQELPIGVLSRCVEDDYKDYILVKIYGGTIVCLWAPNQARVFQATWTERANLRVVPLSPNEKVELYNE